jgi:hypothetical protein
MQGTRRVLVGVRTLWRSSVLGTAVDHAALSGSGTLVRCCRR